MAKKKYKLLDMAMAISVILSSIAIGVAMTSGILAVPFVGLLINQIAGWVVVGSGVLSGLRMFGLMK